MNSYSMETECFELEKQYCRIYPSAGRTVVRSYEVLIKAFAYVTCRYLKEQKSYVYIKEQLMGIRQEMTIQSIQNEFTIKVYEYSARVAIENCDLVTFNQCQTALIHLYKDSKPSSFAIHLNQLEFFRYRLLYFALLDEKELVLVMEEAQYKLFRPQLKDIVEVIQCLNEKNYFKLFTKQSALSDMERRLISPFLLRLKTLSLMFIAFAFYTEVPLGFIAACLGFSSQNDCRQFLQELKAVINEKKETMQCKESIEIIKRSKYLNKMFN